MQTLENIILIISCVVPQMNKHRRKMVVSILGMASAVLMLATIWQVVYLALGSAQWSHLINLLAIAWLIMAMILAAWTYYWGSRNAAKLAFEATLDDDFSRLMAIDRSDNTWALQPV